jgi:hypothetical protein
MRIGVQDRDAAAWLEEQASLMSPLTGIVPELTVESVLPWVIYVPLARAAPIAGRLLLLLPPVLLRRGQEQAAHCSTLLKALQVAKWPCMQLQVCVVWHPPGPLLLGGVMLLLVDCWRLLPAARTCCG